MTKVYTIKARSRNTRLLPPARKSRLGATIYNSSNKNMYAKLGAGASFDDFSVILAPNSYWEIPASHTDTISAVWARGCSGVARISDIRNDK